ncbi:MAG: IS200/IS605 family transposase [Candidatus Marsarchaeota archaeon]|nr:IS200/IS605 family transposase [Candidatus Marsarchaeota archaeon]
MATADFRTGRHVVYKLHVHIVLVPKYRREVMTQRVTACLRGAFSDVCGRYGATLDAFESDGDHAHLLVSYPPKVALSKLVMSLKTISSMKVRAENWPEVTRALWGKHFWSPSYCVVSAGGAPIEVIKTYIENQQSPNRPGRPRKGKRP